MRAKFRAKFARREAGNDLQTVLPCEGSTQSGARLSQDGQNASSSESRQAALARSQPAARNHIVAGCPDGNPERCVAEHPREVHNVCTFTTPRKGLEHTYVQQEKPNPHKAARFH